MVRERSLIVFDTVLRGGSNTFVADLSKTAVNWQASETWSDGPWLYTFSLTANPTSPEAVAGLVQSFNQWLGYHVEERIGGQLTFGGMVCQMELVLGGVRRRRSLIDTGKPLHNAVRAQYTAQSTNEAQELLQNGDFETLDQTAVDTFQQWQDMVGDGAVAATATAQHGAQAAMLTAGATANTYVFLKLSASEGETYHLSFYTRGDGTYGGRYRLINTTTGADLVATTATGVTGTTYTLVEFDFTAPTGCHGVEVRFMCAATATGVVYFDNASVKQYGPVVFTSAWSTAAQSIARYGRIETTLTNTASYSQSDAEQLRDMVLAEQAWPNAFAVSVAAPSGVQLDVMVCGYGITLDWLESTTTVSAATAVGTVVGNILASGDCPFVVAGGRIDANAYTVDGLEGLTPAAQLANLVALGDSNGRLYRAFVGADRRFYYLQRADYAPEYLLMPDGVRQRFSGPLLEPHEVHPSIYRDTSWPIDLAEPGSQYQSARDLFITEVVRRVGQGRPDLRTADLSETDIYAAQLMAQRNNDL